MTLLDTIEGPADLRNLSEQELAQLAREVRDFLVAKVSRTGGHIGPNLGIVEVTLAIHRIFDSPRDPVLFDVGHQAYVHKMLTGRQDDFDRLRQKNGLSGYPSQAESEHDVIENSHASTSLSYADGLAKAFQLRGEGRTAVAVVGDGALTGGMAWEALNNIAAAKDRPLVIVVNDNGRSYTPTVGGLAAHLNALRTNPRYEKVLEAVKTSLSKTPLVGAPTYDVMHAVKRGLKDVLAPQGMFEDLGLKYVGPVDGHDLAALEHAFDQARGFGGPVIVHCLTQKGFGYDVAVQDQEDCLHSPGAFDPATGQLLASSGRNWTKEFSEELVTLGSERPDVVAITAAMRHPTGLDAFATAYPDRFYDVGIAEQHAATSAAGLALGGMHPVVALYATFMNRAFDQILMDVALHKCGVTFVLDRAGVTGNDGPSHNGMWDLSVLQVVPGLSVGAPRDGVRVRELLREAVAIDDAPTALRFPKGPVCAEIPAIERAGGIDVLAREGAEDVLVVSAGAMAETCVDLVPRLAAHGIGATVVDPRWVKPLDPALEELAGRHRLVATVEDNGMIGGVGAAVAQALSEVPTPVRIAGIPQKFLPQGKRGDLLEEFGLTAQALARDIVEAVARLDDEVLDADESSSPPLAGQEG